MNKKIVAAVMASVLLGAMIASAEDAYIESDGSAGGGVNTGFFFGPQSKIEIDFQMTTNDANQVRLFGAAGTQNDDTKPEGECYIGSNAAGAQFFSFICGKSGGARQASNFYAIDTQRHRIVLDFYEAKEFQVWTGSSKSSKALSDFPANRQVYPIGFFCRNNTLYGTYSSYTSTFVYPTKMRVYRFRIWDAGVLVRDYTPFVKGGMPGFKENCSGRFVTGENIAAFTAGGDVAEEKDDPYISSPDNVPGATTSGKTVYLDTGYFVKPSSRVEVDYALLTNWATNNLYTSGSTDVLEAPSGTTQKFYLYMYGNRTNVGYYYWKIGTSEGSISPIGLATAYGVRRTVSMDSNTLHIVTAGYTNATRTVAADKSPLTAQLSDSLRLGTYLPMKIYGLKIYESDVLIKDYLPFVKNGVAGLTNSLDASDVKYSTTVGLLPPVSNVVFTAGGDITGSAYEKEAYIDFPGMQGQGVDTGYHVTRDSCIEIDVSLWNTSFGVNSAPDNSYEPFFFEQRDSSSSKTGVWARMFRRSNNQFSYRFEDCSNAANWVNMKSLDNERHQFKFDGAIGNAAMTTGDANVYSGEMPGTRTAGDCSKTLWLGCDYTGLYHNSFLRLYSFKISEGDVAKLYYVPCIKDGQAGLYDLCTDTFKPVAGGKVRGTMLKGQAFQIAPQPAKLMHTTGENTATLTCLAAGAQSYEWYEDDVKLVETGDSLTVNWDRSKAKSSKHTYTYSVVPVYTVFNETVRGEAATADVEFTPLGTNISIR